MLGLYETNIPSLPLTKRGKVRDIYKLDEQRLLMVATDRLSAFDVVMPTPIPNKGKILTALTRFWFDTLAECAPHHLLNDNPLEGRTPEEQSTLRDRAMVVKRLTPVPIEAVVRGYLAGSAWESYSATGQMCDITLPTKLTPGQPLPQPIFTPATKAPDGEHDQNISFAAVEKKIGELLATKIRKRSLALYSAAAEYALQHGLILADCKFEFGTDAKGDLYLMDEILTPDAARYWTVKDYQPGTMPVGLDKQFVREYLKTSGWNLHAPGPQIPPDVVNQTLTRYYSVYEMLTGVKLTFNDEN